MDSPSPGLETLLARLAASGTEFILVGALAAVAQGAPLTTFDIDVVHRRDAGNVDRLLAAIEGGREYPDLVQESVEIEVEGKIVRVLGLRALADLKRGATDAKGRLALAVLEATLQRGGG